MANQQRVVELLIKARNELGPVLKAAGRDMAALEQVAKGLGAALVSAGTAGIAGITAMVATAVKAGTEMQQLSERIGISSEELSRLKFVAEQNNATVTDLAAGFKFLQKAMVGLNEDGQETSGIFRQLGVSVRNIDGSMRSAQDVFLDVSDAIQKMESPAQRAATALALFGRGGVGLTGVLKLGSAEIRRLGDEAERSGQIISTEFANASDELDDSISKLRGSVAGLTRTIVSDLIPAILPIIEKMQAVTEKAIAWAKENPGLATSIVKLSVALVGTGGLLIAVGSLSAAAAAATPVLTAFWAAATGPVGLVAAAGASLAFIGVKIDEQLKKIRARTFGSTGPLPFSPSSAPLPGVPAPSTTPAAPSRPKSDTDKLEFWQLTPAEKRIRLAEDEALFQRYMDIVLKNRRTAQDPRPGVSTGGPDLGSGGFNAIDPTTEFGKLAQLTAQLQQQIPSVAETGIRAFAQLGSVVGTTIVENFRNLGAAIKQWGIQAAASIASVITQALILRAIGGFIPGFGNAIRFLGLAQGGIPIPTSGSSDGTLITGGVPGRDSVAVAAQRGEGFLSREGVAKIDALLRASGGMGGTHIHVHAQAFLGDVGQALGFADLTRQLLQEQSTGSRL